MNLFELKKYDRVTIHINTDLGTVTWIIGVSVKKTLKC
jgi:hypothetical protein